MSTSRATLTAAEWDYAQAVEQSHEDYVSAHADEWTARQVDPSVATFEEFKDQFNEAQAHALEATKHLTDPAIHERVSEYMLGRAHSLDEADYEQATARMGILERREQFYANTGLEYAVTDEIVEANNPEGFVYMHDFLVGLEWDSSQVVEHVNGNGLDNRRENLRVIDLPA